MSAFVTTAGRDKQIVMEALHELVDAGLADWSQSVGGHTSLELHSGEVFELGATYVRRMR